MELQPDLSSDHGLGVEKNAEVECIGRGVPAEQQGGHRRLRWESSNNELSAVLGRSNAGQDAGQRDD